jgi:CRISPR-associated protein Cmr2
MSYDFYVTFRVKRKEDVDNLTNGSGKYRELSDVLSRILLLNTTYGVNEKFSDRRGRPNEIAPVVYARVGERGYAKGLKALIHSNGNYNDYIACKLSELKFLGIDSPVDSNALPKGSWVLEFPVTLEKPFISQDDVPLYIIDNPVRKDKVFGVPFTSAMAWKGNLRWTMMNIFLEPEVNNADEFAKIRFKHTLIFGTEKGWEEVPKGWTEYLDTLCPQAKGKYRELLKEFTGKEVKEISDAHLKGMLHFYPTFWDKIDMMVINPQDRKTKTGKNPIYFENVPTGANGIFRLVYVPFYFISRGDNELKNSIFQDIKHIVRGVKEMMLTYGFSAKKTTGYGKIKDRWDRNASKLEIKDYMPSQKFGDFNELENVIDRLSGE